MDGGERRGGAGRGGRRQERRDGDLVVRHKVLGVGPKHGLVLQDAEMDDTQTRKMGKGRRQTKEKEIRSAAAQQ